MATWRDVLSINDPAGLEAISRLLAHANRNDSLEPKVAELITVAAALAVRAPANVRPHVKRALEYGASGAELYETLALSTTIGGMSVLVDGLALFDELGVRVEATTS